jgi:hypothetical protein
MGYVLMKNTTTFVVIVLFITISVIFLVFSQINIRSSDSDYTFTPPRPATINNVVLRIDSNIMRMQSAIENLAYSEQQPVYLARDIESINQFETTIYKDLEEMGKHFPDGNLQFKNVLTLFEQWKAIRDEIVKLNADGQHQQAKEVASGECRSHGQQIREALNALNSFSEKRADDFDSAASRQSKQKRLNQ